MLVDDNGVIREMTHTEMTETEDIPMHPTLEERLNAVESAMLDLLTGGKGNV